MTKKIAAFILSLTMVASLLTMTIYAATSNYNVHYAKGAPTADTVLSFSESFVTNSTKNYISNSGTSSVNGGGSVSAQTVYARGDYNVIDTHQISGSSWKFCSTDQLIANKIVTYNVKISTNSNTTSITASGTATYN